MAEIQPRPTTLDPSAARMISMARPGEAMDDAVAAIFANESGVGEDGANPAGSVEPSPSSEPVEPVADPPIADEPIAPSAAPIEPADDEIVDPGATTVINGEPQFASIDPYAIPDPSATPVPDEIDFFGTRLSKVEGENLLAAYQFLSSLTPEQVEAVQGVLDPNNPTTQPRNPAPSPAAPSPTNPLAPSPTAPEYDIAALLAQGEIDPATYALHQELQALRGQVAEQTQLTVAQQQALAAQQQAQQLAQQQAELEAITAQLRPHVESATRALQAQYNLSDADMAEIHRKAQANPTTIDQTYARTQDAAQSYYTGFETILWSDPQLRPRAIAAQQQAALDQQRASDTKRARAGSLAGSGGSIARTPAPPATPEDRQAQMVAEIRAAMQHN